MCKLEIQLAYINKSIQHCWILHMPIGPIHTRGVELVELGIKVLHMMLVAR